MPGDLPCPTHRRVPHRRTFPRRVLSDPRCTTACPRGWAVPAVDAEGVEPSLRVCRTRVLPLTLGALVDRRLGWSRTSAHRVSTGSSTRLSYETLCYVVGTGLEPAHWQPLSGPSLPATAACARLRLLDYPT